MVNRERQKFWACWKIDTPKLKERNGVVDGNKTWQLFFNLLEATRVQKSSDGGLV